MSREAARCPPVDSNPKLCYCRWKEGGRKKGRRESKGGGREEGKRREGERDGGKSRE